MWSSMIPVHVKHRTSSSYVALYHWTYRSGMSKCGYPSVGEREALWKSKNKDIEVVPSSASALQFGSKKKPSHFRIPRAFCASCRYVSILRTTAISRNQSSTTFVECRAPGR